MKKFFFILFALPMFCLAQPAKKKNKSAKSIKTEKVELSETPSHDGYTISGNVTGFPDGTPVSFLNEQTGGLDQKTNIQGGKFFITGKLSYPNFIGLVLGQDQPMVSLFIENTSIKISGTRADLANLKITGSPTHTIFSNYIAALKPYEKLFSSEPDYDTISINRVVALSEDLVKKNPKSFVAPLAIVRLYQASENGAKAEMLFNLLSDDVKNSTIANYAAQQIAESKINPIGSVMTEFSQEDTTGRAISISSFRGKYVLVDFWASWCRPCRMENPNVVSAYNRFKDKNFTVLGISLDQAKAAWVNAIKMDGLMWTHISDLKGWGNAVANQFQVRGIPQNFLIDPQGRIIAKNLRGPVLEKKLAALIN